MADVERTASELVAISPTPAKVALLQRNARPDTPYAWKMMAAIYVSDHTPVEKLVAIGHQLFADTETARTATRQPVPWEKSSASTKKLSGAPATGFRRQGF